MSMTSDFSGDCRRFQPAKVAAAKCCGSIATMCVCMRAVDGGGAWFHKSELGVCETE